MIELRIVENELGVKPDIQYRHHMLRVDANGALCPPILKPRKNITVAIVGIPSIKGIIIPGSIISQNLQSQELLHKSHSLLLLFVL